MEEEINLYKILMKRELNKSELEMPVSNNFKEYFKKYCDLKQFHFIYDNVNSLPRMLLTKYGIIEFCKKYEDEWKRVSDINGYRSLKKDFYSIIEVIGINAYKKYLSKILYYLVTNEKELLNVVNEIIDETAELKDLIPEDFINDLPILNEKIKITNKKNNIKKQDNYYIKIKDQIVKVDSYNHVYKINNEKGGENVKNKILVREFRTKMQNARNEIRA